MVDGDGVPELTETEKRRWAAVQSTLMAAAADAKELPADIDRTAAAIDEIRCADVDVDRFVNNLHIPEDAGSHREAIVSILMRIPDRWGRWISCDAGWYPLIAQLDADLRAVDPTYVVRQVKEKYGVLRFSADPGIDNDVVYQRFSMLIAAAEQRSATMCECCGAAAQLCITSRGTWRWYKTVCPTCVDKLGKEDEGRYLPVP